MIATIWLGIFAVTFAFLTKYRTFRYGLEISFFLIFLFLALRYNFGNDYKGYFNIFHKIAQPNTNLFNGSVYGEVGWLITCRLFKPFGFFTMVAVIAFLNCYVFYRFIKKYAPTEYYWFAVFLYVFTPGFMLIHLSAMRQSITIILFIFSLDYLFRKDAFRYFLCVAIASFFHTSALILIPVYILGFTKDRMNIVLILIIFIAYLLLFSFGEDFLPYINSITDKFFPRYMGSHVGSTISTGLGVLFLTSLFIITLYYYRFQIEENSLLFKLAIISFFFIPLGLALAMTSRIFMYFQPATIVVFPMILSNIKNRLFKGSVTVLIIFYTLYTFIQFFQSETWKDGFGTYQTILSALLIH